jgi:perosamine synthetase
LTDSQREIQESDDMIQIPLYQPSLTGNEKKYVNECLDSTWISSKGHFVGEFESRFAEYTGIRHAAAVCNGTAALHVALLALGIGPGDEVIVPTLTYIASVNAIAYTGATPVFTDSLNDTWQIDPKAVEQNITERTRAVMAVHLYGHPCDMERIAVLAKKNGLFVIEDCAEAFGSRYKGLHVGGFGDIATFSFYGNKTITTGEGGMVMTHDETLHDRAVHFKGQGLAKHREYWHDVIGYNYRMTNICAALGVAQLEQADAFLARKRRIAESYRRGLQDLPVIVHGEHGDVHHSYWMVSILVERAEQRDRLREVLAASGIETRPLFCPVHTMPMYAAKFQRHAVAESLGWRGINLPSWPGMTDEQVQYICGEIRTFFRGES